MIIVQTFKQTFITIKYLLGIIWKSRLQAWIWALISSHCFWIKSNALRNASHSESCYIQLQHREELQSRLQSLKQAQISLPHSFELIWRWKDNQTSICHDRDIFRFQAMKMIAFQRRHPLHSIPIWTVFSDAICAGSKLFFQEQAVGCQFPQQSTHLCRLAECDKHQREEVFVLKSKTAFCKNYLSIYKLILLRFNG